MSVHRYQLTLPTGTTADELQVLVGLLAKHAAAKRSAVILGSTASASGAVVSQWLECPSRLANSCLSIVRTALLGTRIEAVEINDLDFSLIGELRVSTNRRPLHSKGSTAAGFVSVARSLFAGEVLQWQLMLKGQGAPRPVHAGTPPHDPLATVSRTLGFTHDQYVVDARNRQDLLTKQQLPLVAAVGVLAVDTAVPERDRSLVGSVMAALRAAEAPGVNLRLKTGGQRGLRGRLRSRRTPMFSWPLQLNLGEAVELLAWPTGELVNSGGEARSRWMPAPNASGKGVVVGVSRNDRGRPIEVSVPQASRLMHTQVLGATGSGKSTVLAQMALQDIAAGKAVAVLDPKRDLIRSILERLPKDCHDRVVVFDPAVEGRRLGLNPLRWGKPEQATDFIVALMRGLFARSWGIRTEDVLKTGILSLALAGNDHTLVDLPRLLTDARFRNEVQTRLPPHPLLAEYWTWFEALGEGHRAEITAPLLSRLRSLLLAGPLHQILGQPKPSFDFDVVFRKRQTVLVPLSAGSLGSDAAGLLGALVMARLWQLTQQRTRLPEHARHPVMLYLDEFHQYLHLPTSMAETLAQARGLGVGLTLAHQHLDQLTPDVRAAVLANARNRIIFQLSARDAKAVAADMAPVKDADLQALGPYEIYLRTVNQSATTQPVSGETTPLPKGDPRQASQLAMRSIQQYGQTPKPPPSSKPERKAKGKSERQFGASPRSKTGDSDSERGAR